MVRSSFVTGFAVLAMLAAPAAVIAQAPAPAATAAPADLPEIGRVRSLTPACAAMRELVIPAFAASMGVSKKFDETAPYFSRYVETIEEEKDNTAVRDMLLSRMGQSVSLMMRDTQKIAKALGDPRLSATSKDPAIVEERKQLNLLYDVQMDRANILNEYLIRQNAGIARTEFQDNSAFASTRSPGGTQDLTPQPTATPIEYDRRRFGQPVLDGKNGFADKHVMTDWTNDLGAQAKLASNIAAKALLPIAKGCTDS
jgi:hypothetical protein